MIDIVSVGNDIGLYDTETTKAANILGAQLGALEYAPDLGIDLKFFLSENLRFQNASFKAYLVQVLANNNINVASVQDVVDKLFSTYTFNLSPDDSNNTGLIAK